MAKQIITVPDIGGAEGVDVIEICVAVGDTVEKEDSILVLESDKASMDIPSPESGVVSAILIKEGDKLSEGDKIFEFESEGAADAAPAEAAKPEASADSSSSEASSSAEASEQTFNVPDIGGSEGVDVIELCVAVGDAVEEGDSLVVLESDKASMEVPSPASGTVVSFLLKEGDKVSEGDAFVVLSTGASAQVSEPAAKSESPASEPAPAAQSAEQAIAVPDIGGSEGVDVIEICVAVGDSVEEGDSLVVLESDKASMEIPSPTSGTVKSIALKEGDKVSEGHALLVMEVKGASAPAAPASAPAAKPEKPVAAPASSAQATSAPVEETYVEQGDVYAGPAVRKLARQLGVNLSQVPPTGPRKRHTKDDVKGFVKKVMTQHASGKAPAVTGGQGIDPIPAVDFAKFGEIEMIKMSKIKKLTAQNMARNWLNIPHVTQFDDADITELEAFRKGMKAEAEKAGVKLTPVPFLLKACAAALKAEPSFNVSMHHDGEHIVQKKFINIGIAVDTPHGLMVPVIKDVDKKGLYELANEVIDLAGKARDGKLKPNEMQGGCFTISSLGPIGGTGFTPIVNAPEVAILGVSKADIKPKWNGKEFEPRQMLPLCLSYDHRAINGSDAGRFFTYLSSVIADVRRLIL